MVIKKGQHCSPKTEFKKGGTPWITGKHHIDETKKKIGKKSKEWWKNPKNREKISGKNHYLYGKHHSKEHNKRISELLKGNKNPFFGKNHSEETKRKLSESKKGKNNPHYGKPGTMKGKHHSGKTKRKLSESHKGLFIGEKNPRWLGGISFEPYTLDFNESFKEKIKERDNYCCVICNKPEEELKRKLAIHHIDYNKFNSFPQNCVSLCSSCHSKTNLNRAQWIIFFQSLFKERYGYQYTQDQKIILDFMK